MLIRQLALEGAIEDGGEQGVEFGGGLGLQALQAVHGHCGKVLHDAYQEPSQGASPNCRPN